MPDYSKGLIYKLICNDNFITENYIGSCCDYKDRKKTHKSGCNNVNDKGYNNYKYKFIREHGGIDNWSMIIIKEFPCNSNRELECEERVQMDLLGGELNTYRPFVTEEERKESNNNRCKEYRELNKDKIKEYHKEYKKNNKDKFKEYKKEYYEINKDKIYERRKQKFECECGGRYTLMGKSQHFKTKTHINYINNSKVSS